MSSTPDNTNRDVSFRIIHRNTVQACVKTLEKATFAGDIISMHAKELELPDLSKAVAFQRRSNTNPWPLIVEVGSELDLEFQCVLEDANYWLNKVETSRFVFNGVSVFLKPFPIFQSHHLHTEMDGCVSNRKLVNSYDEEQYEIDSLLSQCATLVVAHLIGILPSFREMYRNVQWMCENPEQRLYVKRSDQISTQSSETRSEDDADGSRDDGASVRTDAQSEADSETFLTPTTTRSCSPNFEDWM